MVPHVQERGGPLAEEEARMLIGYPTYAPTIWVYTSGTVPTTQTTDGPEWYWWMERWMSR